MYLLNKQIFNNGVWQGEEQTFAISNIHLLAIGLYYVSQGFRDKKFRNYQKNAQLLHVGNDYATVIGNINQAQITSEKGTYFDLSPNLQNPCYLENFLVHKKDKTRVMKSSYKTDIYANGIKLLGTALHFQNSRLNTSQSKWYKEGYFYFGKELTYILNNEYILDNRRNVLLDFHDFYVRRELVRIKPAAYVVG